jgi:hypothetical protein
MRSCALAASAPADALDDGGLAGADGSAEGA